MGALPISVRPRITPGASRMPVERIGPQVVSPGGGDAQRPQERSCAGGMERRGSRTGGRRGEGGTEA